jgi:hypothetical protein
MPALDHKHLMHLLYPYMFMLKEGPEIKKNSMDYSLLILQTKFETLQSPAYLNIENLNLEKSD